MVHAHHALEISSLGQKVIQSDTIELGSAEHKCLGKVAWALTALQARGNAAKVLLQNEVYTSTITLRITDIQTLTLSVFFIAVH